MPNVDPSAIISKNSRFRLDDYVVGKHSVIDDYCYFSTKVEIGDFFHVAPSVTIAGGPSVSFRAGSFGSLSSGVRVFCASDDFINDIGNVLPIWCEGVKDHIIKGDVFLEDAVTIGSNSVVMPNNYFPEGVCIGALSFVPYGFKFEPWSVYAGWPKLRLIKKRNKDNVLRQIEEVKKREF